MRNSVPLPREIWILVISAAIIALGYGIMAPVLPQYAKSFEVSNFAASMVISAFAFMRLSFAPVSGRLANKFGERKIYIGGIYVVALSSFAAAFAGNYWQLLIFRGLGGTGSVTFSVAAMSLIFRLAPANARGRASAVFGAGFLIGNITGPAIGAVIAPLGYRAPFVIYAVLLFISAMVVKFAIPQSRLDVIIANNMQEAEALIDVSPEPAAETITLRDALQIRRFRIVLFTAFAHGWTNVGVRVSIVPLFAISIATAPTWLAGGLLTAFALGNAITLIFAGKWSDIYGRRPVIVAGLFLSGFFTLFMGDFPTPTILLGMSLVAGMGAGLAQPSQQGVVADIVGSKNGSGVVSFFQQAGDLGYIVAPIVLGLILDYSTFSATYYLSAGVLFAAGLFWVFLDKANK